MTLRVLIVDDEPHARSRLRDLLASVDNVILVGEAEDGAEALRRCDEVMPDLVLLDIRMPGIDGLEVARRLATLPRPPVVIFLTAFDDRAIDAFERGAVDYLLKPVRTERLVQAIERARRIAVPTPSAEPVRRHFTVRRSNGIQLVPVDEVLCLRADEKYVRVVTATDEHLIEESLSTIERGFGDRFLRIHRNCLVAVERIRGIRRRPDGSDGIVVDGLAELLEISRRNLATVRARLTGET